VRPRLPLALSQSASTTRQLLSSRPPLPRCPCPCPCSSAPRLPFPCSLGTPLLHPLGRRRAYQDGGQTLPPSLPFPWSEPPSGVRVGRARGGSPGLGPLHPPPLQGVGALCLPRGFGCGGSSARLRRDGLGGCRSAARRWGCAGAPRLPELPLQSRGTGPGTAGHAPCKGQKGRGGCLGSGYARTL